MTDVPRIRTRGALTAALVLAVLAPGLLPTEARAQGEPDFLFRSPTVSLQVRAGGWLPRAEGEIYDFTTDELTIERSDFRAVFVGVEASHRLTDRIDVALSADFVRSETDSEFRDWVDQDDLPITQTTTLTLTPVQLGVKLYLTERGRAVGSHAWIPERWSPYVGGGAGVTWYTFTQVGDFVDFTDLAIFFDEFRSTGAAPTAHLRAGMDVTLSPRLFLTTDARYTWGSAELRNDFVGFEDIDLTGFQWTLGVGVRL